MLRRSLQVLLAAALLWFGAAAQAQPVNVGQVDGGRTGIGCLTPPGAGTFVEVPDHQLTLSLTTSGRPVLVMFDIMVQTTSDQAILLRASIDGQDPDHNAVFNWVQTGSGQVGARTLSYSRVFPLAKGAHHFGVQMSCQGNPEILAGRWLTVIELR
jgi:hypothetical protein